MTDPSYAMTCSWGDVTVIRVCLKTCQEKVPASREIFKEQLFVFAADQIFLQNLNTQEKAFLVSMTKHANGSQRKSPSPSKVLTFLQERSGKFPNLIFKGKG